MHTLKLHITRWNQHRKNCLKRRLSGNRRHERACNPKGTILYIARMFSEHSQWTNSFRGGPYFHDTTFSCSLVRKFIQKPFSAASTKVFLLNFIGMEVSALGSKSQRSSR